LVSIAAVASFGFINHANLYLMQDFSLSNAPLASYVLATIVIYLFLRLLVIALEMRPPRAHAELVRCPECGQWLDDPTTSGLEAHRKIALTPKPTEKEVASALALRKAVDASRVASLAARKTPDDDILRRGDVPSNVSSRDLVAALNDPDLLERLRHSPQPPRDPRLKR
jgi:hypothetical protein